MHDWISIIRLSFWVYSKLSSLSTAKENFMIHYEMSLCD